LESLLPEQAFFVFGTFFPPANSSTNSYKTPLTPITNLESDYSPYLLSMIYIQKKMNVNVNFFLRGKGAAALDRECVIYATINVDDQKGSPFSTKQKVPAKYWMTKGDPKEKVRPSESLCPVSKSYQLADKINDYLIRLESSAYELGKRLGSEQKLVTPEAILRLLREPNFQSPKRFIDVVDELIASLMPRLKKSTMLTYRTRRRNISKYLHERNLEGIFIQEFRYSHFEDFQMYMLAQVCDNGDRKFCTNNINKHCTLLNRALNYGVNKEFIRYNPLGELGLKYDKAKQPQYLRFDERKRIYECDLSTLSVERDVAVFLYSTGLSYTDYLSLDQEHLYYLPSGEQFLKKPRDKSEIYSIVPLLKEAQEIIYKYGSIKNLPRPDLSDLNKALKILGEVCKAPFSLSTSTFRDTFSSMMENEYMIKHRVLMFMMGHTNPRQLQNYSAVQPERILHELNKNDIVIPFNLDKFQELVKAS
jgi:integrase